ncbi:PREDICTED: QWRF motif-containing protein 7 [Nicotiana attenuata]|uniref:Qwrf motif-containing protein 7 n=1 Tax=Nicotiana attenuata TaxID=49451 RepID=A0A314LFD5_NICAT|nr:PREDICTED: QWRF motif-containing protein 7 [Nicotiana attenuata]OIT40326.1 qwrf motif-containing protein 7 [Nicotiana attenuata]
MEKEKNRSTRKQNQQPAINIPRSPANSPRLLRSKSGMSLPEIPTYSSTDPVPSLVNRSKSTTKMRTYRGEENVSPLMRSPNYTQIKTTKKSSQENGDHHSFGKFLQRNNQSKISTNSSSAWALSPGRPLPNSSASQLHNTVPKSPSTRKLKVESKESSDGRGVVVGVLKYFKQKKVSPVLEEDFHQYRIMNNRLVQWRFVNARAEASMATIKRVAQKKLFNVWLRISIMRNFTAEKRIQVQKLKHEIKINRIMNSQGRLLREWQRLEVKNSEAVGRVARKLSAVSLCLPLVDGAEAKVTSVYDAVISAEEVMDSIEDFIMNMQWQVEQSCFLLTQLIVILKQEKEFLEELENHINTVSSLEVEEETLRVHSIQLAKEWSR